MTIESNTVLYQHFGMMQTFADRLVAAREQRGISQARLAELVGVRTMTISRYETGRTLSPSSETAVAMARELNVSLKWLLDGDLAEEPESHVEPVNEHPQDKLIRKFEQLHGDRFPAYVYRMIRAGLYGRYGLTEGQLLDAAKRYQKMEEEQIQTNLDRIGPPKMENV